MDFTSDSHNPSTAGPVDAHTTSWAPPTSMAAASTADSELVLDNDELRLAALHDEKDILLEQRDALLQRIDRARAQLAARQHDGSPAEVTAPRMFDESTLAAALARATAPCQAPPVPSRSKIDGNVSLHDELSNKYDALPLLNWDLRFSRLRALFPDVALRVANTTTTSTAAGATATTTTTHLPDLTVQTATLQFDPGDFQLVLELQLLHARIHALRVLQLSPQVRLALAPLVAHAESTCNVSFLLLGCYEYARLWDERARLWRALDQAFKAWNVAHTSPSVWTLSRDALSVTVYLDISFKDLPFPHSQIRVDLSNKACPIPHAHAVAMALIREYGVHHGIESFVRATFNL